MRKVFKVARRRGSRGKHSWSFFRETGKLQERHILMATDLGLRPESIFEEYALAPDRGDRILLEWVEDLFFAKHGHYSPVSEHTPESQAEDPSEESLLVDPFEELHERAESDEDDDEIDPESLYELSKIRERTTPVSLGEIAKEDKRMLRRQADFRKAAGLLTQRLAEMPEVCEVRLFGSVALPLWKEVSCHSRLRRRGISVYHQCNNIDMAVWVTSPEGANRMRKTCSQVVQELNEREIHLSIAHHTFCLHLVDASEHRYLGMVCHYSQCPKHKPACAVPGCGAHKFVQILPWFRLKPERLDAFNSQILFRREGFGEGAADANMPAKG